jgi:large subunit ribosomal protein L21
VPGWRAGVVCSAGPEHESALPEEEPRKNRGRIRSSGAARDQALKQPEAAGKQPGTAQWRRPAGEKNMHAIIKTGGKQYRVAPGETVKVETLAADVGQQITLSEVLTVTDGSDVKVGSPFVAGASVVATVVSHGRHDKVTIFKMKRRKHYQKHQGHRQNYTELRIDSIG